MTEIHSKYPDRQCIFMAHFLAIYKAMHLITHTEASYCRLLWSDNDFIEQFSLKNNVLYLLRLFSKFLYSLKHTPFNNMLSIRLSYISITFSSLLIQLLLIKCNKWLISVKKLYITCLPLSWHSHHPSNPFVFCSTTVKISPRRNASSSVLSAILSYTAFAYNFCCNRIKKTRDVLIWWYDTTK